MTAKVSIKTENLTAQLVEGVKKITEVVAGTLGPRGRTAIIAVKGKPVITTKDGVTVASFVELEDPIENVAAQIVKQASEQTEKDSGDGTTTSTVLAYGILRNAFKYLTAGEPPVELKSKIEAAAEKIIENLKTQSKPVRSIRDVEHIATISANGDKLIGQLIATAIDKVGKDGAIIIDEARSIETTLNVLEGFRFDSGYISNAFITDEKRSVLKYERPLILVTDRTIDTVQQIFPLLTQVERAKRPLLIISDNIEKQPLAALILNTQRGQMQIAAVRAPRYGEERRDILKDLAITCGATLISQETGIVIEDVKLEHLGQAKSVEATKNMTTIINGFGKQESIDKRIEQLKNEVKEADLNEAARIQERITRLASGIGVIYVGGATEIEAIEKKHRIEDALEAVRSAQQEGTLPGGGIALLQAARHLEIGVFNDIMREAVLEPIKFILRNANESEDVIIQGIIKNREEKDIGYDVVSQEYVNMYDAGIIDPTKVVRCALQNAVSVACSIIMASSVIVEK